MERKKVALGGVNKVAVMEEGKNVKEQKVGRLVGMKVVAVKIDKGRII